MSRYKSCYLYEYVAEIENDALLIHRKRSPFPAGEGYK